jgi:hypothetical protein
MTISVTIKASSGDTSAQATIRLDGNPYGQHPLIGALEHSLKGAAALAQAVKR